MLREAVAIVEANTPMDILEATCDVEEKLAAAGMQVSDRRSMIQDTLVAAHALLNGREVATLQDLFVLEHSCWDKHEDRPKVWKIIAERCDAPMLQARTLFDALIAESEDVDMTQADKASHTHKELSTARAALNKTLAQCKREINAVPGIDVESAEVSKMLIKLDSLRKNLGRAIAKLDWNVTKSVSAVG